MPFTDADKCRWTAGYLTKALSSIAKVYTDVDDWAGFVAYIGTLTQDVQDKLADILEEELGVRTDDAQKITDLKEVLFPGT